MKQLINILLVALIAVFTACNKNGVGQPQGTISINAKRSIITIVDTTATKAISPEADDNYSVKIAYLLNGQTAYSGNYGQIKDNTIPIEQGVYRVSAENRPLTEADWEAPRYAGNKDVTVKAGRNTPVELECAMTNTKVTIAYTPLFNATFNLEKVTVANQSGGTLVFTPSENRAAYFAPGILEVVAEGTVKATSKPFLFRHTIHNASAATWNKIKLDLKLFANPELNIELENDIANPEEHITDIDPKA